MGKWRDIRRKARRRLHSEMRQEAAYYPGGDPAFPNPPTVGIRIHEDFRYVADMRGTSYEYAEWADEAPRLVVMKDEVSPARGDVFCPEAGEAYRVDHAQPDDDITITVSVVRLRGSEAAAFSPPASP